MDETTKVNLLAEFMETAQLAEEAARGFRNHLITHGWSREVAEVICANLLAQMISPTRS